MQVAEIPCRNSLGRRRGGRSGRRLPRFGIVVGYLALILAGLSIHGFEQARAQSTPPKTTERERSPVANKSLVERLAEWLLEANRTHQDVLSRLSIPVATPTLQPSVAQSRPAPPTPTAVPPTVAVKSPETARQREAASRAEASKRAQEALEIEEKRRATAEHEEQSRMARRQAEAARKAEAETAVESESAEATRRAAIEARENSEAQRRAAADQLLEDDRRERETRESEAARVKREAEQRERDAETRRQAEALATAMAERTQTDAETRAIEERERSEVQKAREAETKKFAADAARAAEERKRTEAKRIREAEAKKLAETAARAAEERKRAEAQKASEAEAKKVAEATARALEERKRAEAEVKKLTEAKPAPDTATVIATPPLTPRVRAAAKRRVAARSQNRSRKKYAQCRRCGNAGQTIAPPGWYVVKRGDTLWSIASRHYHSGSRSRLIRRSNARRIASSRRLRPCQRLYLPRMSRR